MTKYLGYLKILGVTVLISIAGFLYWQNGNYQERLEQQRSVIGQLEAENSRFASQVEGLQQSIEDFQNDVDRLNQVNSQISEERRRVEERLRQAQGRQEVVWRRPTLVQRMIQRNFDEWADEFSCTTGALEKCDN